jgi:GNAT superfamily N-acetyltransferase
MGTMIAMSSENVRDTSEGDDAACEWVFRAVAADEEPAASLLEAMRLTLTELNDGLDPNSPEMPSATPADFDLFLVGFEDETPICCGGLKPLGDGAVEVKRMYVVPQARGRGVARMLLARLETEARRRGFAVARLDTGPRQPSAERLYREAGYAEIGNFNANPVASFWGEKRL